jgi:hypothetical protein
VPSDLQSVAIRAELVEALRLDLIGPSNDHAFANELLPEPPSRWYLTGYLVPKDAPEDQRTDETSTEEIDGVDDANATDDAAPRRTAPPRTDACCHLRSVSACLSQPKLTTSP